MKAIVVKAKNQSEMKFVSDLLKKLGIPSTLMDIEEIEDQAMSVLMKKADRTKKVSRETIMKKLKAS
jgi:7-cyano-7-deazaguanine synthase in queuosine biosynthesis